MAVAASGSREGRGQSLWESLAKLARKGAVPWGSPLNNGKVKNLQERFLAAGGTQGDFDEVAQGGVSVADGAKQDGVSAPAAARDLALRVMRSGVLVEYGCYNDQGRNQGNALVRFDQWIDQDALTFRGKHLAASDPYYEHWAQTNLNGSDDAYHFCLSSRRKCKATVAGVSHVVHLTKWRAVAPQTLLGGGYSAEALLEEFRKKLEAKLAALAKPQFPPPPGPAPGAVVPQRGTGLDEAYDGGDDDWGEKVDDVLEMARKAKGDKPKAKPKAAEPKGRNFGSVLLGKAQAHQGRPSNPTGSARDERQSEDAQSERGRPLRYPLRLAVMKRTAKTSQFFAKPRLGRWICWPFQERAQVAY